eukprot:TRINITY_DN79384_c0_g1_i1.p1 TRINITY_DN79384_c0_g1~~TRINITY_DN79384_c0_g1_i1.p1  ORF type:complete len:479 (+),score=63.95 TRINITY_DN79384_c0_g1_i1:61-1497(+)
MLVARRAACVSCALNPRTAPVWASGQYFRFTGSLSQKAVPEARETRVVLLSGFLGAGKTTVLDRLLRDEHGFRLGVVVNDLASVNVDASVLQDALESSGTPTISLENGCVCCTAAGDLKKAVQDLADSSQNLDAVVVELSGVAEPARAKEILESSEEGRGAWTPGWTPRPENSSKLSVRVATIVDSPAFATDYMQERSDDHDHEHHMHTGECDERYGTLLAEQVESADLVLLNKADAASEAELLQAQSLVRVLNRVAETHVTEYGKVEISDLLDLKVIKNSSAVRPNARASEDRAVPSCCAAKTCSSTNKASTEACSEEVDLRSRAESRFGITSFVYRTDRMMSYEKLLQALEHWQEAKSIMGTKLHLDMVGTGLYAEDVKVGAGAVDAPSPLVKVLRSKGSIFLDTNPFMSYYWSHAGKSVKFSKLKAYNSSASRTELVFIGIGYDEAAIRALLDSCLLGDGSVSFFDAHLARGAGR